MDRRFDPRPIKPMLGVVVGVNHVCVPGFFGLLVFWSVIVSHLSAWLSVGLTSESPGVASLSRGTKTLQRRTQLSKVQDSLLSFRLVSSRLVFVFLAAGEGLLHVCC